MKTLRSGRPGHYQATLGALRKANPSLQHLNLSLRKEARIQAKGKRLLEVEIIRRKAAEVATQKGRAEYQKLFAESLSMQRKLRLLTRQIIAAREEDRKQISRELHDEVVQNLVSINVQLAALGKGATIGHANLKSEIARTQRLVENSVNAVHRFARELRPAVLDDLGLIPALHAFNKNLAGRKKLRIHLTAFGGVESLASDKRTVLYRVAQEALTNVVRHAEATDVRMSIDQVLGGIRMEVSDNGKSFAVQQAFSGRSPSRLGLIGMRERLEMVGGTLTILPGPVNGTTIRAEIPAGKDAAGP
jgi:two-component system sensor histidine kinase DegS